MPSPARPISPNCTKTSNSARSSAAAGVRPATQPGSRATRLAVTSAPATMSTTVSAGTVGCGTTLICPANRFHSARPSAMPSGTPTMAPTVIAAVDCHATVADS